MTATHRYIVACIVSFFGKEIVQVSRELILKQKNKSQTTFNTLIVTHVYTLYTHTDTRIHAHTYPQPPTFAFMLYKLHI